MGVPEIGRQPSPTVLKSTAFNAYLSHPSGTLVFGAAPCEIVNFPNIVHFDGCMGRRVQMQPQAFLWKNDRSDSLYGFLTTFCKKKI
jgi:hypothetical protein